MSPLPPPNDQPFHRTQLDSWSLRITLLMVAMVFCFFCWNVYTAVFDTGSAYFKHVLRDHLAVFLGLPQCAAVSFAIVCLLRQTEGPFELKVPGFDAKGASGQVLMWIAAFLAMTLAMHLVWQYAPTGQATAARD